MLVSPLYNVGSMEQNLSLGDFINTAEDTYAIANAAGVTLIGGDLVRGDILRSGAAGVSDALPTADDLIKALIGSINKISPPDNAPLIPTQVVQLAWPANLIPVFPGSSFRRTIINNNTGTLTLTVPANSGISLLGTTTIITVNWREYLIRILNSSPITIISVTTTNTTLTLTNVDLTLINNITPGMSVFGTGIGAAAVVTAVNRDTGIISVSVASTATANNIAVTFTPTVTVRGLRSGTV